MAATSHEGEPIAPRFSVVIPTFQRRDLAVAAVRSLAGQTSSPTFEVVVVVDGSDDGSAGALRALDVPFPLTVLEQPNRGAASARNHGAAAARGEIVLFLDDDMEAHPRLLAQHERSHREGADVVLGHLPLHPASPAGFLARGVGEWADSRLKRLTTPGARLTLHDLLTGQLSLSLEVFRRVGGFDTDFTIHGSFGNEDVDFGYRLQSRGYRIVFDPDAISWQNYVVRPREYLRQWRQAGRADVVFARKHPDQADVIFALNGGDRWVARWIWRPLAARPRLGSASSAVVRGLALSRLDRGSEDRVTRRLFKQARALEYWRGVQEAGGVPTGSTVRVLAYHAIADLRSDPVLAPYAVRPAVFRDQLDALLRAGYRFVGPDEFLRFLNGQALVPRKALLLTFDDCYRDLLEVAAPILEERNIPAVAFAVTRLLGGANEWDADSGATTLRLLDADGLREVAKRGIEIGAHSRTHRPLSQMSNADLSDEIAGSARDLAVLGLAAARFFAYPYGDRDERVVRAVSRAGLEAAFTCEPGCVRQGVARHELPRIEVGSRDVGWRLRWRILRAR